MRTYQFAIGKAEAGMRLDRYLVQRLPARVSRAMIQRSVREGRILVGDRPVKASYRLREGDEIIATIQELSPPSRGLGAKPQDIPLDIVYEDAVLLVVNKPPGLVSHPAPGHWDGTLVNALTWHLQQAQGSRRQPPTSTLEPPVARAGIVHRLDKDTSGLLVVAKTETVHAALSKQLKSRQIRRSYLAIVEGRVPLSRGTVSAPIGRHLTHRKVMTVRHLGGRTAITHYRVLKRLVTPSEGPVGAFPYTVLDVSLETGRTHQIRVHLAHLGHPILGDPTYGFRPGSFWRSLGISRQLLHAYRLVFEHPVSHTPVTLEAPVPEDVARWIPPEQLRQFGVAK